MTLEMEYAKFVIFHVYNAQVHQKMNAYLAQTSFLLKDQFLVNSAFVMINTLMILKINFANNAHPHAILA